MAPYFHEIELLFQKEYLDRVIKLALIAHNPDGSATIADLSKLEWKKVSDGEYLMPYSLSLRENDAMKLLNAFVAVGAKLGVTVPEEKGKLKATQDHLEDMRKIAFQLLPGVKP